MTYNEMALLAIIVLLVCNEAVNWFKRMNDDDAGFEDYVRPVEHQHWTVRDFKYFIKDLPDDMPVFLMDSSTDDVECCNYQFTNQEVGLDDYYRNNDPDDEYGEPAGKAVFLYFDNMLNENPIDYV